MPLPRSVRPCGRAVSLLLEGCQVLDLTDELGLSCGQLLADLGATVVHIEAPGGCRARRDAVLWAVRARNQQSIVIDLHEERDRERFRSLVASCDVLLESGDVPLDMLGLNFEQLVAVNPALVMVSMSPFGTFGPKRDYAATDLIIQAAAGNVAVTGFGDRAPLRDTGIPAWSHLGVAAAGAALVGLRSARRSGVGTRVDVSAQEATSLTSSFSLLCEAIGSRRPKRPGPDLGAAGLVECADGYVYNTIGGLGPTRRFTVRQAAWMAQEGALDDDLAAACARGEINADAVSRLQAAINTFYATRTKQELLDAALEHGFVLAPVNSTLEVLRSEQFAARGAWWSDGELTMPGPFAHVSAAPLAMRSSAPGLDEHAVPPFTQRPAVAAPENSRGQLPLDGVKVLDFGWILAGPYSSRMLADYGASVVKVESASRLDLLRLLGPYYGTGTTPENSASFASTASGKLGLSIDLANPAARAVILDLVRWADVVSESFAPGAMGRLGLDYETLRAIKPELVMVSSSLFGQTGPYAAMPGFGTQGAAVAGLVLPTGYPDRAPCGPYGPFTDYVAPRYQFLATLAALEHRDRTGEGTYIDISQAETGLHAMAVALARTSLDGTILDREANTDPTMRPHGIYRSAGADEWIAIAVRDARDWTALCDVMGTPELALAPPAHDIDDVITSWTSGRGAEETERLLQQSGVPAHHVVNSTTAPTDAHLVARAMFVETRFGDRDALVTSTGYHFNGVPPRVGPAPRLGENSVAVLRDHLGYAPDTIDALLAAGVITTSS